MNVTPELLQGLSEEFDDLTATRAEEGAEVYGPTKFLENDLPVFIYEELADLANYARFLYIRVRILEEASRESGLDLSAGFTKEDRPSHRLPFGPASFSTSEEVQGFLPDQKQGG